MPALIKELMLDYSLNRLSIDLRSDLTIAIQNVLLSGAFNAAEVGYLNLYLSGYTAHDIAMMVITIHESEIEAILERLFTAIEQTSGYTDQSFVHKLELSKKYRKPGISKLQDFLQSHGKSYSFHDLDRER